MKKSFSSLFALAILATAIVGCGSNSAPTTTQGSTAAPAAPSAPTPPPAPKQDDLAGIMTKAKFDQIQNGMTYEAVSKIIGGPGELTSETGTKGDQFYTAIYSYKGNGDIGANAILMFQDDKLMNKTQMGLQ